MKDPNQSWREYLLHGVALMEGATPDGKRNYDKAETIFLECASVAEHSNDPDLYGVAIESLCRFGQCLAYQGGLSEALQLLGRVRDQVVLIRDLNGQAQCLLLIGVIEDKNKYRGEAESCYRQAWQLATDPKLRADIADCQAKRRFELAGEYNEGDHHFRGALLQIETAVTEIGQAPESPLVWHAKAAIYTRASRYHCLKGDKEKAAAYLELAGNLFDNGSVKDFCLRAAFWSAKSDLASNQGLRWQATKYFAYWAWSAARCKFGF